MKIRPSRSLVVHCRGQTWRSW